MRINNKSFILSGFGLLFVSQLTWANLVYDQTQDYDRTLGMQDSRLTIFMYPASRALDWSTPKAILKSFINSGFTEEISEASGEKSFKNSFGESESFPYGYRSTMGHTIAHIQCRLPEDPNRSPQDADGETDTDGIYDKWASLSGQEYQQVDLNNAREGIGLEVLFYNYMDGFIIAGQENRERLSFYTGSRVINGKETAIHPRYMSFKIDEAACLRLKNMVDHFESYHYAPGTPLASLEQKKPNEHLYFSTNFDPHDSYHQRQSDPQALVGGGCAPLGVSLIREAGILVDEQGNLDPVLQSHWQLKLQISEKLIGDSVDEFGEKINAAKTRSVTDLQLMLNQVGDQWEYEGYPSRRFANYDPEKLWQFVGEVQTCLNSKGKDCSAIATHFLSAENRYRAGRQVSVGEPIIFKDSRQSAGPLVSIWDSVVEAVAPAKQKLNNSVEGILIDN